MLLAISLQRTYYNVPAKELKRRARAGDSLARGLYKAAAYGTSLRALLWAMVSIIAALFFVYVARSTATWFAVMAVAFVLWLGFLWLPAQNATKVGQWLATSAAPVFAWILQYIHPLIDRINRFIRKHRPIRVHTGLYEKEDLIGLLERQEVQADNRITRGELDIARHALTFGEKQVSQIMTPRRVVKMVSVDDTIGPVLMSELHDSGFSRFPVFESKQDNIVGVTLLRDLVTGKTGGTVAKFVNKKVAYVHQDQDLYSALAAIIKTHQHMFIVVNSFEEFVGVVTMEDILEEIVGRQIIDEFDQYDDMRAVAAREASKERDDHNHPSVDNPEVEVVE